MTVNGEAWVESDIEERIINTVLKNAKIEESCCVNVVGYQERETQSI